MSVTLAPLERADQGRVVHIAVLPEQEQFARSVVHAFEAEGPDVDFHVIEQDTNPVGFFKIDRAYAAAHDFAQADELGLRGFVIDAAAQGKGIASAATRALRAYLTATYPFAPSVVLTVNCTNQRAIRCYLSGGFTDSEALFHGGRAGPQHILRLPLGSPAAQQS